MNLQLIPLKVSTALQGVPILHNTLRRLYCTVFPGIRFKVQQTLRQHTDIFVLKIGANDGVVNDPFADFLLQDERFRGVLVEPIPHYAALLQKNYAPTQRFAIEAAAIGTTNGTLPMFCVDEQRALAEGYTLEPWLRGVASLDKAHVLKHLPPAHHTYVQEVAVPCLTVDELLRKHGVQRLDLLHIDAEGFDYEILRQFDFSRIKPAVVLFERKHLSDRHQAAAQQWMESHGYSVLAYETDFLCLAGGTP